MYILCHSQGGSPSQFYKSRTQFDCFFFVQDAAKESRMKAAGLLEELVSLLEKRAGFSALYDAEMDKFKSSRDTTSFSNALKKINADYNAASNKISTHQSALVKEDPELADKVFFAYICV